MNDLQQKLANLSAQQRAAVLKKLQQKQQQNNIITKVDRNQKLALSYAQERLWQLLQNVESTITYNNVFLFEIEGNLNKEALQSSLHSIVQRHEVLRTQFLKHDNNTISQHILEYPQFSLDIINLTHVEQPNYKQHINHYSKILSKQPFDLKRNNGLYCFSLLQFSDTYHVFILCINHIIFDGWSIDIFKREFIEYYEHFAYQKTVNLPMLSIQYVDFAAWQRKQLTEKLIENKLDYWKRSLDGATTFLHLPTDKQRPQLPSFDGKSHVFRLPASVMQKVENITKKLETTIFTVLLSLFNILLFLLSSQKDILIGTPVSGRNHTQLEHLIGFFAYPIVLRSKIDESFSFQQFIQQIQKQTLQAFDYQDVPFEQIVKAVQPKRTLQYHPLFQVMFSYLDQPLTQIEIKGLKVKLLNIEFQLTEFDLFLTLFREKNTLCGTMVYNTDIFEQTTIESIVDAYIHLIQIGCENLSCKLIDFHLPAEIDSKVKQYLSQQTHDLPIVISANFTADLIQKSLIYWSYQLKFPISIKFADYNQVFQQLINPKSEQRQNQQGLNIILLRLQEWFTKQHSEQIIEDFIKAIIQASQHATFLVVICPYPKNDQKLIEIEYILKQAVTTQNVLFIEQNYIFDMYPVSDYEDEYANQAGHIPYKELFFNLLGTACMRKFIASKRANYKVIVLDCDNTLWTGVCAEVGVTGISIEEYNKVIQEFILEQQQNGFILCLCSKNIESDVFNVFEQHSDMILKKHHLVSWRINWEAKSANIQSLAEELNLGLDSFIFVDDSPIECAEVMANCPQVLTLQLPQNTATIAQFLKHTWAFDKFSITKEDKQRTLLYQQNLQRQQLQQQSINFSDFIQNLALEVKIVEAKIEHIERISQMSQRTNQFNFTTIRYSESDIKRLMQQHTPIVIVSVKDKFGDYGIVGLMIYHLHQQLLELETFLLSCRALGRGVEYQMLAYLGKIARKQQLSHIKIIFKTTAKNLPAQNFLQMTCKQYIETTNDGMQLKVDAISLSHLTYQPIDSPQTQNMQKVVTLPLFKPQIWAEIALHLATVEQIQTAITEYQQQHNEQHDYVEPRNEIEFILVNIWKKILKVDKIGIFDNFFTLGGDSISAIQVVSQALDQQLVLPNRALFEYQTISELAAVVEIINTVQNQQDLVTGEIALTPIQHWFFAQNLANPHYYNQSVLLKLTHAIQADLLEKVIKYLLVHHDALRLQFQKVGEKWKQYNLAKTETFDLKFVNLQTESQIITETEIAQTGLNIEKGKLINAILFTNAEENYLFITIHHLAIDDVSWRILLADLATAYQQLVQQQKIKLSAKTTAFQDWSLYLQQYADTIKADFWLQQSVSMSLPIDFKVELTQNTVRSHVDISLSLSSEQTTDLLNNISQAYNIKINDVLLTALALTLTKWTGQSDILVDLETHGREAINENFDLSRTIGWFSSLYPIALHIPQTVDIGEIIKSVKEQLRCIPRNGFDYVVLRYLSKNATIRQKLQDLPQAQISFNYLGQLEQIVQNQLFLGIATQKTAYCHDNANQRAYLIDFNLVIIDKKLNITCSYSSAFFQTATMQQLLQNYLTQLQILIEHCLHPQAGGYTPSDFPDADLNQDDLDNLLNKL